MTIKADLSNAVDKGALLQVHISNRMALERPLYVSRNWGAVRGTVRPSVFC
jgi:hypothetical protein